MYANTPFLGVTSSSCSLFSIPAVPTKEGHELAFTRYCHHQYCMVCEIQKEGQGEVVHCATVVQQYGNSVGNAGGVGQ